MRDRSDVIDWLLDSDPALRWQVLADLVGAPDEEARAERSRVATEGWGAKLLAARDSDGLWMGGACFPTARPTNSGQPWTATAPSLTLLRLFGLEPNSPPAREAIALVAENCRWEHDGQRFFDGEVEPCINGQTVATGAYFGVDVSRIVDRLLTEQMEDGGWNCDQEVGSTRGSFDSTICVLEGLLEYENAVGSQTDVTAVRRKGEEYLLERRMFRSLSTGEVVDPAWTRFSFPNQWHYDVLRGLEHLRHSTEQPDPRVDEALDLVQATRLSDGRWPRQKVHPGDVHFEIDAAEGEPSRWITLRAIRVLEWAGIGS
jgi:hypothetical protein